MHNFHPAALPVDELLKQCRVWRQRRSGPGGQHRNKVETAVVIEHLPSGILAEASERRSQQQNRLAAIFRLRIQSAIHIRSTIVDLEHYQSSSLWNSRQHGLRMTVSAKHDDFPSLLAEALDVLSAAQFKLPAAAAVLGTTTSQLVKLIALEPAALVLVNEQRRRRGLRPCRA